MTAARYIPGVHAARRLLRPLVSGAVAAGLSAVGHAILGVLYVSGAVTPLGAAGGQKTVGNAAEGDSAGQLPAAGARRGWRRLRVPRRPTGGEGPRS